ncbi:hypothetical protein [Salisediminibacterium halotolerans]|nr:hypothetical protein [Salisediminibacterium haloalkalitolerans]
MNTRILLFGYVLFISGVLLFGMMHVAIAIHIPDLTEWSREFGMMPSVLDEIFGWVPYLMSITLFVLGASIILFDLWKVRQNDPSRRKSPVEILSEYEKEERP